MRKIKILTSAVMFLLAASGVFAAEAANDTTRRLGNGVLFEHGIAGEDPDVYIMLTTDGKRFTADDLHLEGEDGNANVGPGKKGWWNVLQDFSRGSRGEPLVEIKAVTGGMVFIKGGCFQMGDTFGDGNSDEKPVHEVCLDDFHMDRYEVTQKAYSKIMGENPSYFRGDDLPVESVTWHNARDYCAKVGKRLPTEAEWEYAARSGGKREKYAGGSESFYEYAWYSSNSDRKTHPVGQKKSNGLGLYDMTGNVNEWLSDLYDSGYYSTSPRDNPTGPSNGGFHVLRGGPWNGAPKFLRASRRFRSNPIKRYYGMGFRCARSQ